MREGHVVYLFQQLIGDDISHPLVACLAWVEVVKPLLIFFSLLVSHSEIVRTLRTKKAHVLRRSFQQLLGDDISHPLVACLTGMQVVAAIVLRKKS